MTKPTVLILCTGNSCRSHLAEGILRAAAGDILNVVSAGSKPAGYVHPLAIRVMTEIGIDLSTHRSKHMDEFLTQDIETVITVCGNADQACPVFPGQVNRQHWPFDDPAHARGTEEEQMAVFRRVRDEIRRKFETYARERRQVGGNFLIEAARPADEPAIRALLRQADLPAEDFAEHLAHFFVVRAGAEVIGAVGLERHGDDALLRSLVVAPEFRRQGLAGRLLEAITAAARREKVKRFYLLTTTAEEFFVRRGFGKISRSEVAPRVAASREFQSLCPASAVCLRRQLAT